MRSVIQIFSFSLALTAGLFKTCAANISSCPTGNIVVDGGFENTTTPSPWTFGSNGADCVGSIVNNGSDSSHSALLQASWNTTGCGLYLIQETQPCANLTYVISWDLYQIPGLTTQPSSQHTPLLIVQWGLSARYFDFYDGYFKSISTPSKKYKAGIWHHFSMELTPEYANPAQMYIGTYSQAKNESVKAQIDNISVAVK